MLGFAEENGQYQDWIKVRNARSGKIVMDRHGPKKITILLINSEPRSLKHTRRLDKWSSQLKIINRIEVQRGQDRKAGAASSNAAAPKPAAPGVDAAEVSNAVPQLVAMFADKLPVDTVAVDQAGPLSD